MARPALGVLLLVVVAAVASTAVTPSTAAPNDVVRPGVQRSTDPANVPLDGTVVVSPTIVRLGTVQPGTTRRFTVTVRNRRTRATTFDLVALGVRGADDPVLAVRFLEPVSRGWGDTAAPWLAPTAPTVELPPRGVAVVPVVVHVPRSLPGGGEFAAIAVRQAAGSTGTGGAAVGLQGEVAVVVLARAPGSVRQRVTVTRTSLPRWRTSRHGWNGSLEVRNRGNVEARMSGTIVVRNFVTRHVASRWTVATRTMLPGGAGAVQARWKHTPLIGIYRVQVRLHGDGSGAPTVTRDAWLFVVPPWWFWVALAVVVGGWIGWSRWRDHREVRRLLADDDLDDLADDDLLVD